MLDFSRWTVSAEWIAAVGAWAIPLLLAVIAHRQGRIARHQEQARDARQRDEKILDWANRVLLAFSQLETLCRAPSRPADVDMKAYDIAATASALIDEGRFFFPNVGGNGRNFVYTHTNGRRHGLRQKVLDDVVRLQIIAKSIYDDATHWGPEAAHRLWLARQSFCGLIQEHTLSTLSMRTPSEARAEAAGDGIPNDWRSWPLD